MQQLPGGNAKGVRDLAQHVYGEVSFLAFNHADIGAMNPTLMRQKLLG